MDSLGDAKEEKIMDEKKEGNQLWDCFEPIFEGYDPDSSPFVWEYIYSKIYSENEWKLRKEKMHIEDGKIELEIDRTRQIAYVGRLGEGNLYFGGETDFNFSERQYIFFRKRINVDDIELLKICSKRHHALENFSLMPRTGNLQGVKGGRFDRLDRFIWLLNDYYDHPGEDLQHKVFQAPGPRDKNKKICGKKILKAYLDSFRDSKNEDKDDKFNKPNEATYRYCSTIYKMDNIWVDRMIKNGKEDMVGDHIKEYLNLAMEYWDTKFKKYSDIYNVAYDEEIRRSENAISEMRMRLKD